MQTATANGVDIEYDEAGSGEPILMIHGALVAGTFADVQTGLLNEPDAAKVSVPSLSVVDKNRHELFSASHAMLMRWLPNVEGFEVPRATHFRQVEQPEAVAEGIARFVAKHPMK